MRGGRAADMRDAASPPVFVFRACPFAGECEFLRGRVSRYMRSPAFGDTRSCDVAPMREIKRGVKRMGVRRKKDRRREMGVRLGREVLDCGEKNLMRP